MDRLYCVYILTNRHHTVFYTGVTNGLRRCIYEHKSKLVEGFTKRYNVDKLVYYEVFEQPEDAIRREKQIKAGSRVRKIALVNDLNPQWLDLYSEL